MVYIDNIENESYLFQINESCRLLEKNTHTHKYVLIPVIIVLKIQELCSVIDLAYFNFLYTQSFL